jgi:hypothetical protein
VPHRLAFGAVFGRAALLSLASIVAAAPPGAGCSSDPAKAPSILRPIDEPHAVAIMARVFSTFGLEPVRNRVIKFGPNDTPLTLDIAAKQRRFGIAYVTWQVADKLGENLPKRRDREATLVVRGNGDDDDVHAALLFAADYMQDDLSGERHTSAAIAAEGRLEVAAREIVRRAQLEAWP